MNCKRLLKISFFHVPHSISIIFSRFVRTIFFQFFSSDAFGGAIDVRETLRRAASRCVTVELEGCVYRLLSISPVVETVPKVVGDLSSFRWKFWCLHFPSFTDSVNILCWWAVRFERNEWQFQSESGLNPTLCPESGWLLSSLIIHLAHLFGWKSHSLRAQFLWKNWHQRVTWCANLCNQKPMKSRESNEGHTNVGCRQTPFKFQLLTIRRKRNWQSRDTDCLVLFAFWKVEPASNRMNKSVLRVKIVDLKTFKCSSSLTTLDKFKPGF